LSAQSQFVAKSGGCRLPPEDYETFFNYFYFGDFLKAALASPSEKVRCETFLEQFANVYAAIEGHSKVYFGQPGPSDPGQIFRCDMCFSAIWVGNFTELSSPAICARPAYFVFFNWIVDFVLSGRFDRRCPEAFSLPVFDERVCVTAVLNLHFIGYRLLVFCPAPGKLVEEICEDEGVDFDLFCRAAVLLPLRWLASSLLLCGDVYTATDSFLNSAAFATSETGTLQAHLLSAIGMLQIYFSMTRDKDRFLEFVGSVFGLFERVPREQSSAIELTFLTILSMVLLERNAIHNEEIPFLVDLLLSLLLERRAMPISAIALTGNNSMTEGPLAAAIAPFVKIAAGQVSLVDDSKSHILTFLVLVFLLRKQGSHLRAAGSRALLGFPEWTELAVGDLNLRSVLDSKYLFALLYHFTHKMLTNRTFALQYLLNLFVTLANLTNATPFPNLSEIPVVAATSVPGLAKVVPSNFQEFIRTPVFYNHGIPDTLIQLIAKFGTLGSHALVRANVGWREPRPRIDAKLFIDAIRAQFRERQAAFERRFVDAPRARETGSKDLMVYPCVSFLAAFPGTALFGRSFGNLGPAVMSFQVYACGHSVPRKSLPAGRLFPCPKCSERRNRLLPVVSDDLREFNDDRARELLVAFSRRLLSRSVDDDYSLPIAYHLLTTELRFRGKPEILAAEETAATLRGVFAALLFHVVTKQAPRVAFSFQHPLLTIIRRAIDQIDLGWPANRGKVSVPDFIDLVRAVVRPLSLEAALVVELLRRAVLFAHFMIRIPLLPVSILLDWDVLLAPDFLGNLFNVQIPPGKIALEPLSFAPLPEDFVSFIEPPFNVDIQVKTPLFAMDLIRGTKIAMSRDPDCPYPFIFNYLQDTWGGAPVPIMALTGDAATTCFFSCFEFGEMVRAIAPYLDKHGQPDPGFLRSQCVSISWANVKTIIDEWLSGSFAGRVTAH
jgi:hypothetical protein